MTDAERVAKQIGLTLTTAQVRAARYLERFGLRFCAHFGYENVVKKAREHFQRTRPAKGERIH